MHQEIGDEAAAIPLPLLFRNFEGLGNNCEFGIVQRLAGYDPPGLFRNVGFYSPDQMIRAIERGFAGLFDDGRFEFVLPPGWQGWRLDCRIYDFTFHTNIPASVEKNGPEWTLRTRSAIWVLRRIKAKLLEDLEAGEKIFVFRHNSRFGAGVARRMHAAIRRHGNGRLLCVREDPAPPSGTVEALADGLFLASIAHLSNENPPQIDLAAWERIARTIPTLRAPAPAQRTAGPGFRDIADPARLGTLAEPHRLRLGAQMMSRPPSPLFQRAALAEGVAREHMARCLVPAPAVYAVTDHELGGFGLLRREGRVFVHEAVQPTPPDDRGDGGSGAEIIDSADPVGVVLAPPLQWGRFVLEMLPRLYLFAKLQALGRPVKLAVPIDCPAWVREFIALHVPDSATLPYHSRRQRVRAPCFLLPSTMLRQHRLHPEMNAVVQALLDRAVGVAGSGVGPARKLYLSGRGARGGPAIANADEVEAALADLGFAVLHPHALSVREQLASYAGAECVVAQFGPLACNALFAPIGTPVFCFGSPQPVQSGIAALRGQPVAFMQPSGGDATAPPGSAGPAGFRVDCGELVRELPAFLRFAAQRRAE